MLFVELKIYNYLIWLILIVTATTMKSGEPSKFRILAPQFICPKEKDSIVDNPDKTIISIQKGSATPLDFLWTVRWSPLETPSQRLTLMLWKAVRNLVKKLNREQTEPNVYVIDNEELIPGVDYIFNVTAVKTDSSVLPTKTFRIDNTHGKKELQIEGRGGLFSILLTGSQITFADVEFVIEAKITTCQPTQDYYFKWTVQNTETSKKENLPETPGSRLVVPPYSMRPDQYDVNCQVVRFSTDELITQTGLPFQVTHRNVEVFQNADYLMITRDMPFSMDALVTNHDLQDTVNYKWSCLMDDEPCDSSANDTDSEELVFPTGLSNVGRSWVQRTRDWSTLRFERGLHSKIFFLQQSSPVRDKYEKALPLQLAIFLSAKYNITLEVTTKNQTAKADAMVEVVAQLLPVIKISLLYRTVNEGSMISFTANITNIVPSCILTWYFADQEYLDKANALTNDSCYDCMHGEQITDTVTIYSLEENFLNELTDFTNDTEARQITATIPAAAGRARFRARCECSFTFECETKGEVFSDVMLKLNKKPKTGNILVSPLSGVALETVFRISTLAAEDPDGPLTYSFFCRVGDQDLELGSFEEHLAVETVLPYIEGGTEVWVKVCDSPGACAKSVSTKVNVLQTSGLTVEGLLEDLRAYVRRCELLMLRKLTVAAVATYSVAGHLDLLSRFTSGLRKTLPAVTDYSCLTDASRVNLYEETLRWLDKYGLDVHFIKKSNL